MLKLELSGKEVTKVDFNIVWEVISFSHLVSFSLRGLGSEVWLIRGQQNLEEIHEIERVLLP
jgi:hypothetical protein